MKSIKKFLKGMIEVLKGDRRNNWDEGVKRSVHFARTSTHEILSFPSFWLASLIRASEADWMDARDERISSMRASETRLVKPSEQRRKRSSRRTASSRRSTSTFASTPSARVRMCFNLEGIAASGAFSLGGWREARV